MRWPSLTTVMMAFRPCLLTNSAATLIIPQILSGGHSILWMIRTVASSQKGACFVRCVVWVCLHNLKMHAGVLLHHSSHASSVSPPSGNAQHVYFCGMRLLHARFLVMASGHHRRQSSLVWLLCVRRQSGSLWVAWSHSASPFQPDLRYELTVRWTLQSAVMMCYLQQH